MLFLSHAGTVLSLGTAGTAEIIDKGRFPHIGNTQNHDAGGAGDNAPLAVPFRFFPISLTNCVEDGLAVILAAAVAQKDGIPQTAIILRPLFVLHGVGKIALVQNQNFRFVPDQLGNIGIFGGGGNAGIDQFDDDIHLLHRIQNDTAGFSHMPRVPVNIHEVLL